MTGPDQPFADAAADAAADAPAGPAEVARFAERELDEVGRAVVG